MNPVTVTSGAEAIERCRAERFAAVLIDHRMPGMSGTEVFEAVGRHPTRACIAVRVHERRRAQP